MARAPGPAAPEPPETVNSRLRRLLASGKGDAGTAAQLFSIEVTALPGVPVPDGPVEKSYSGTFALLQLMARYAELTPEQQAAAAPYLRQARFPEARLQLPPFQFKPFTPPRRATAALFRDRPLLLPPLRAGLIDVLGNTPSVEDQYRTYFRGIFNWANQAIASFIGTTPLSDSFDLEFIDDPSDAWALTTDFSTTCAEFPGLADKGCRIGDGEAKGQGKKTSGASIDNHRRLANCHTYLNLARFKGQDEQVIASVVTHEVFHCYQQHAVGSLAEEMTVPAWLNDGEATYVQAALVPDGVFAAMREHWSNYVSKPKRHLFDRAYDALGFYAHLVDTYGVSGLASDLLPAHVAGVGGNSDKALSVLLGGAEDAVFDTWASSYFMAHEGKKLWTIKGPSPGNLPGSHPEPQEVSIGNGNAAFLPEAAQWELSLARLTSTADVLEVALDSGHAALIDKSEKFNLHPAIGETLWICTRSEPCLCPEDKDGEVPPAIHAQSPFDIGLTGARRNGSMHARGHSLDEYCKARKQDPPGKSGGGAGGGADDSAPPADRPPPGEPPHGKATSDPHLATLDGRWYDLQAVGEFVLSRSTVDDFQVQVRFASDSPTRTWSVPVALATRAGRHRIVISVNLAAAEPVPTLRIDGQPREEGVIILEGAAIRSVSAQWGPGYEIRFADGTLVGANITNRAGLSTWINPASVRRGHLTGLLGDGDGDAGNDPRSRDGKVLSAAPDADELYRQFGASWRVKDSESLFDYAAGESTRTFTDTGFPDRSAPAASPAALQSATQLCSERGVTDGDLLRNCAFDVATTGRRNYVSTYQSQQYRLELSSPRVVAGPAPLAGTGIASSPLVGAGVFKGLVIEGHIANEKEMPERRFSGAKGDIVYVDKRNCIDLHFPRLSGPDGKELISANMCGARVVLPADGEYRFVANVFADHTGDYRYPLVAIRPDRVRELQLGAPSSASVERGEHDVWRFNVSGRTRVAVDRASCSGYPDIKLFYGDTEVTASGLCSFEYELPQAGTYQIVVNVFDTAAGPYAFTLRAATP